MCRRTQLLGAVLIALGIGFLLSCLFGSGFFLILIGILLVAAGLLVMKQH